MVKIIANGIFMVNDKVFRDEEWIKAWNANEIPQYYKCEMLNHGRTYKYYKPSVAGLVLQRGMYLQMQTVGK